MNICVYLYSAARWLYLLMAESPLHSYRNVYTHLYHPPELPEMACERFDQNCTNPQASLRAKRWDWNKCDARICVFVFCYDVQCSFIFI